MCMTDFEYYVEPRPSITWVTDRPWYCSGGCGRVLKAGDRVFPFSEMMIDEFDISDAADEALGSALEDGERVDWLSPAWLWFARDVVGDCLGRGIWFRCERCQVGADLLSDWCSGEYGSEDICEQIVDHWFQDPLYRSVPFGRLVLLARRGWRDRGGAVVSVDAVRSLVDAACGAVRVGGVSPTQG